MNTFIIRLADLHYIDSIYNLISALEATQLDKSKFNQIYRNNMQNPNVHYFVAIHNEAIIGFISLHIQELLHHAANIGEIQELIVQDTFQHKGIGKLLFEKAKETAYQKGCTQLEVCCNQIRSASHNFYYNQGMSNKHFKFTLKLDK